MKVLILAGGFAKRLGPIGEQLPKPLLVTEGDTLLGHILKKVRGMEVYISTNKKFAPFFSPFGQLIVEEAEREEEKLGAVSAINNAIKVAGIDDDLLVICADNYFSSDLSGFISNFTGEPLIGFYYAGASPDMKPEEMATVKFDGCEGYPPPSDVFYIRDFKEKVKPPLSCYVSTGIYILPKRIFPLLEEFCREKRRDAPGYFIQYLLEKGERLKGYILKGEWYDISHKSFYNIFGDGRLVKSDERYVVVDKQLSDNFVVSITILHAGKRTTGHSHPVAETYFFIEGEGEIELDGVRRRVRSKDVVPIKPNQFHRVYNTSNVDLVFVSAFERYGERG
ncbi:MAG: sugar phosphate nucleotidyltransferase [Candidatus Hadarchaeales archaeon]